MKSSLITLLLVLVCCVAGGARAADEGAAILTQRCAGCHNLTGPAPHTLKELWARKAPDLFYAGNKYRAEWLRAWLQKPGRIRVAGVFYADHVRSGEKSDEVDTAALEPHLALTAADADAVTEALMRLKAHDDLIAAEKIEPGSISKSMGEMAFDKFLGCMACHEIEPGYGGASGPELYTAGRRLQPEFTASYIRSPQAWDPKIWMPNKKVSDPNIQKMVHYLAELAKEHGDGK
jgi:mono/diheme cytochrome c family protein